jgi:UDP-N-acetylglucosamine--N-acetylmuramyl-(pentapeptide) pyrophosphoryl-undecaprenol N-acetylglucosamine transferase
MATPFRRKEGKMPLLKVIISGGGTGGHIFPAIAIANEIKSQFPEVKILFIGAKGKMEMEKVPTAGYEIIGLPISGIQRRLTLSNLLVPFQLIKSIIMAWRIVRYFKPDVVVGVGGYASAAVLYAASAAGLIQEQNSYAGITNKWLGRKVKKICVAYAGMEKFFPKDKIVITGNPVRQEIANAADIETNAAKAKLGFEIGKPLILVIGGSLGARTINQSIQSRLLAFTDNDCQLLWQTGRNFRARTSNIEGVKSHSFISDMATAYAAADIVISRAGAISISELTLLRKPAILVPSPNVTEDHQTHNALALTHQKAALLVRDKDAESDLVDTAMSLVKNDSLKKSLSENIGKFAKPDALVNIVDQIKLLKRE